MLFRDRFRQFLVSVSVILFVKIGDKNNPDRSFDSPGTHVIAADHKTVIIDHHDGNKEQSRQQDRYCKFYHMSSRHITSALRGNKTGCEK